MPPDNNDSTQQFQNGLNNNTGGAGIIQSLRNLGVLPAASPDLSPEEVARKALVDRTKDAHAQALRSIASASDNDNQ